MSHSVRSRILVGVVFLLVAAGFSESGLAQRTRLALQPSDTTPTTAGSSQILRIRKMTPSARNQTPIFKTAVQGQSPSPKDWWRVEVEYETKPDWIDQIEFIYYVYMKDQSNKGAEVMFRTAVTYVNVQKGRHFSDMFLHPNTIARMGRVEQVAVVIKVDGVVVAQESTAKTPNWWDRYRPVEGVLLNRAQTPFHLIDFDMYEQIKTLPSAR